MTQEGFVLRQISDLRRSPLSAVIAGPDPAIHAVSCPQIEVVLMGKVTAWMPWSSHGMTEAGEEACSELSVRRRQLLHPD